MSPVYMLAWLVIVGTVCYVAGIGTREIKEWLNERANEKARAEAKIVRSDRWGA